MPFSIQRLHRPNQRFQPLGAALARAFRQEPNFTYILPDDSHRAHALAWFFGTFVLRLGLLYGEVYTTPSGTGSAVWLPPGVKTSLGRTLRAGLLAMPFRFGLEGTRRSLAVEAHLKQVRQALAPPRRWYLVALGVAPSLQGQGLGSALLQPVLEKAEAQALPCYLETFQARTVAFYRRFGFAVVHTDSLPKGGPAFWCMMRAP